VHIAMKRVRAFTGQGNNSGCPHARLHGACSRCARQNQMKRARPHFSWPGMEVSANMRCMGWPADDVQRWSRPTERACCALGSHTSARYICLGIVCMKQHSRYGAQS
jgi:hypothetical protein